jgi:AAA domain/Bifunctional DNA primase/polymerase, N-terminal
VSSTPTDDLTPRTSALALLDAGLTPLPTRPGEKSPAINWTEYQHRGPTRDEIEGWYAADPRRGVALVMGSALLAVDVDTEKGGDPAPFIGTTPAVQHTPNYGFHFIYRLSDAEHASPRVGVRKGVDIRAGKSIIVFAPTEIRARDGEVRAYRFADGGLSALLGGALPDAMDVPAVRALLEEEAARTTVDGEPREPWVAETLAHPERVLPGTQEDTLTRLAWWAAGHLPMDVARAVLGKWMQELPLGDPHDPWTDEHLSDRLERAFARRTPELKVRLGDGTGRQSGANHGEAKELRFVSYDELANEVREIAKRPWLVPGWLRARGLFLIAGASHFGKTWLSIDLAVSAAIGGDFLGRYPVDPGPEGGRRVLYIVGEDDAPDFMDRLDQVLAGKRAQPEAVLVREGTPGHEDALAEARATWARNEAFRRNFRVHYERQFVFGDASAQAALLEMVREFKPALIIFDPLKDLVPGEDVEGFFAKVVEYTRFLRDLREAADCCVGLVHHTKKALEWDAPDKGISGRSEFIASFEHRFICFPASPTTEEIVRVAAGPDGKPTEHVIDSFTVNCSHGVIKRRLKSSEPLQPVAVRYAGLGEEIYLLAEEVTDDEGRALLEGKPRSESLEPLVLQTITAEAPISANKLHETLQAMGVRVARKIVQKTVSRLVAAGRITKTNAGLMPRSPGPQAGTLIGENGDHQED